MDLSSISYTFFQLFFMGYGGFAATGYVVLTMYRTLEISRFKKYAYYSLIWFSCSLFSFFAISLNLMEIQSFYFFIKRFAWFNVIIWQIYGIFFITRIVPPKEDVSSVILSKNPLEALIRTMVPLVFPVLLGPSALNYSYELFEFTGKNYLLFALGLVTFFILVLLAQGITEFVTEFSERLMVFLQKFSSLIILCMLFRTESVQSPDVEIDPQEFGFNKYTFFQVFFSALLFRQVFSIFIKKYNFFQKLFFFLMLFSIFIFVDIISFVILAYRGVCLTKFEVLLFSIPFIFQCVGLFQELSSTYLKVRSCLLVWFFPLIMPACSILVFFSKPLSPFQEEFKESMFFGTVKYLSVFILFFIPSFIICYLVEWVFDKIERDHTKTIILLKKVLYFALAYFSGRFEIMWSL